MGEAETRLEDARHEELSLREFIARLEAQAEERERRLAEQAQSITAMRDELTKAFAEVSQSALKQNNELFLTLANENLAKMQETAKGEIDQRKQAIEGLVNPIKESLEKVDRQIVEMNEKHAKTGAGISQQLQAMAESERLLRSETANLVKALRNPGHRGRWGEMQLRRVAEMAGMVEHCDFVEQLTARTEEGTFRPDMVVRLSEGRSIVVDAKTPLDAYLNAIEATDEATRQDFMRSHARQVREQVRKLASKRYWDQFEQTPDVVVMFIPGDPMLGAATEMDPELMEFGIQNRVLLATPTSLISLLRIAAHGWRQQQLELNAQRISELGKELYQRIRRMSEEFSRVGQSLNRAVVAYNATVGSLEARVLPQARRFKELQAATGEDIEVIEPVDTVTRQLQSPELGRPRKVLVENLFD